MRWTVLALVLMLVVGTWWLVQTLGGTAETTGPSTTVEGQVGSSLQPTESLVTGTDRRDAVVEAAPEEEASVGPRTNAAEGLGIHLTILDGADQPVAGARINTFEDSRTGEWLTDELGGCRLPIKPSIERMRVRIEAESFFHVNSLYERSPELTIILHQAATVAGRVLDAELSFPLQGARIALAHGHCNGCEPDRAVAQPDGRYELAGVPLERDLSFLVEAEGYPVDSVDIRLRGACSQELDFRLERGSAVAGWVFDLTTADPIPDAVIHNAARGDEEWRTDTDGRFEAQLLPSRAGGRIGLRVSAAEHCGIWANIDPQDLGQTGELRFPLPRGARIEGMVRDQQGGPVASAYLFLSVRGQLKFPGAPKPNPLDSLPRGWHYNAEQLSGVYHADTQGVFRTGALIPWSGPYLLRATHEGYDVAKLEGVELGGPGETTWVTMQLKPAPPTGTIRGRLSLNGEPRGGWINWTGPTRRGDCKVAGDGSFRIEDVEVGGVEFDPRPQPFRRWGKPRVGTTIVVDVPAGTELVHDFDVQLLMTTISGQVRSTDGQPLRGAMVEARATGMGIIGGYRAETPIDGGFELEVPSYDEVYEVIAALGPLHDRRQGVRPGSKNVDFVLGGLGRLRYRPVDVETGDLVPSCDLYWRPPGERAYRSILRPSRVPDPEGWYEGSIQAGAQDLMARADAEGYQPLFIPAYPIPAGDVATHLELKLERGVGVEVHLAEGEDLPPDGATLLLLGAEAWPVVRRWKDGAYVRWDGGDQCPYETITRRILRFDDARRAKLKGLAPGVHRFKVFPEDIVVEPSEVEVTGKEKGPILIRWRRLE